MYTCTCVYDYEYHTIMTMSAHPFSWLLTTDYNYHDSNASQIPITSEQYIIQTTTPQSSFKRSSLTSVFSFFSSKVWLWVWLLSLSTDTTVYFLVGKLACIQLLKSAGWHSARWKGRQTAMRHWTTAVALGKLQSADISDKAELGLIIIYI